MHTKSIFLGACLALTCAPAQAQSLSGPAEATDGDSLSMTDTRIRLFGIDAVEGRQSCAREGVEWACGEAAKSRLAELIAGQAVSCSIHETDQYGRLVATCRAGTTDLGEAMVLSGLAVAYREISDKYVEAEDRARKFKQGIWASAFEMPADWRKAHPEARQRSPAAGQGHAGQPSADAAPAQRIYRDGSGRCAIKGNHSRRGEWIYHLPGQPYYEQTRPEALFCTEEAAQLAGYRPSRATR